MSTLIRLFRYALVLFLTGIFYSCSKSDNEGNGISETGFPISVTIIAKNEGDQLGSNQYFSYNLKKGGQDYSNLQNLTIDKNLPNQATISNIFKETLAFRDGSGINILNFKSGSSYQLDDIKSKLEITNFYAIITNNSTQVFCFYNDIVANGELGTIFKNYNLSTEVSSNFLSFDKNKKIGGGYSNTGIIANDKYLFIQYVNIEDPMNNKYFLDIYDVKNFKKYKSYSYDYDFGFRQSENMLFITKLSSTESTLELLDFEKEMLQTMENSNTGNIFNSGNPSNGNIFNSKVGLSLFNEFGDPDPMILDFNTNQIKTIKNLNWGELISNAYPSNILNLRKSYIDLKNEIFVFVYPYRVDSLNNEFIYEIIFINFDGKVLSKAELPQYTPEAIITIN